MTFKKESLVHWISTFFRQRSESVLKVLQLKIINNTVMLIKRSATKAA